MNEPIKPTLHGVLDYCFAAVQLFVPSALGLNKSVVETYAVAGTGLLTIGALTDNPAGVKPVIPMKTHQKLDLAFLVSHVAMTALPMIRNDKKALGFHLAFLALGFTTYVLSDYE